MKKLLFLISLGITLSGYAQINTLEGEVIDETGAPMVYSSVVLLNPKDSTMEFFGITNQEGHFSIRNISNGNYLMQVAFLGYQTLYANVGFPRKEGNNFGTVLMKPKSHDLNEVKIEADYVPFLLKKDTIEFNSAAFKVKPDAMTEDLLRRLPGIEIDRAGNIKAFGEDVKKVLVDGKEFFGNDPRVATRNVPADAVDKVQVYNKKSDEAEFTGVDDGVKDKTLNLVLKEDKKNALFGDVLAGTDFDSHLKTSAKAYRFTDKDQVAVLGMYNNINQFGFSFSDYLNFNGGMGGMMHGGETRVRITSDNSFPIDFGMPVTGLTSSGAGGFNYSHATDPNNKVFISYLGNGTNKDLIQQTGTTQFTDESTYFQNQELNELKKDQAHRVNMGWRKRINPKNNLVLNGEISRISGSSNQNLNVKTLTDSFMNNSMTGWSNESTGSLALSGNGSYLRKLGNDKTIWKVDGDAYLSNQESDIRFNNQTLFYPSNEQQINSQFQRNKTVNLNYSMATSLTRKLNGKYALIPEIRIGNMLEQLERTQGDSATMDQQIDSLSPSMDKTYRWLKPGLSLKRTTEQAKFTLDLEMTLGKMASGLKNEDKPESAILFFTPHLGYEWEYKIGRRFEADFYSQVNTPTVNQLLPVVNNLDPLFLVSGNPHLKPEYSHNLNMHWILFDQFSFTSFVAALNGQYTRNKINWSHHINENLARQSTLVNVDNDYQLGGNIDFSTAISKLGIKFSAAVGESYNRGENLVNEVINQYSTLTQRLNIKIENRNKKKLDVVSGIGFTFTRSAYSLQQSLNRNYRDLSWFGEIRYNPTDKWNFEFSADLTNYNSKGFDETILIPLLKAEASYYFMKNNRAMLSVNAFDLLNKNSIVQRTGELNYLQETRSNTIGRYVLLTFKYRLNKFGSSNPGMDININRR